MITYSIHACVLAAYRKQAHGLHVQDIGVKILIFVTLGWQIKKHVHDLIVNRIDIGGLLDVV